MREPNCKLMQLIYVRFEASYKINGDKNIG